jgi:hypothetical protein
MSTFTRRLLLVTGIVFVSGALWIAWLQLAPRRVPEGQPELSRIDAASLDSLRDAFNAETDAVRLLVLLSPT